MLIKLRLVIWCRHAEFPSLNTNTNQNSQIVKKHHNVIVTPSPTSPSRIFSSSLTDSNRAARSPNDKMKEAQCNVKVTTDIAFPREFLRNYSEPNIRT